MKSLAEIKQLLRSQETFLSDQYGVSIVGVFGSFVRDEQTSSSDVDILIDVGDLPRIDLFDLVRLEAYLSELLGVRADITIKRNLRRRIGKRILDEVVNI